MIVLLGQSAGTAFFTAERRMHMKQKIWLTKYGCPLLGKTAAITGATGGLGREICRGVLSLKGSLLLLNRSREKTDALIQELKQEFPEAHISFFPLDLSDMDSVRSACQKLQEDTPDILLHNAGIYNVPRYFCSTGLQNIFQVNFASPYYMTRVLLPSLRKKHSHVAVVGSIAHRYSQTDPEDLDFHTRKSCPLPYGNSKRYLMYAFWALLKNETEVTFAIGHPGITLTNISNHYPAWVFPLIRPFLKLLFMKPETASRGILFALCHPMEYLTWIGPKYCSTWGNPSVRLLKACSSHEIERIFSSAEDMYRNLL